MSSRVYIAPFGEPVAATLDLGQPELGGQVRYVAEAGDFYRGIALDGNAGGDECCLSIPEAGTASDRDRLVCRSGRRRRRRPGGCHDIPGATRPNRQPLARHSPAHG